MYAWSEAAVKWLLKKIQEAQPPKKLGPIQIPVAAWFEEATADGSRYAAAVPVPGCTVDNVPMVTFSEDDTYDFYPTCQSGDGTVTVYAYDLPGEVITLQSVVVM